MFWYQTTVPDGPSVLEEKWNFMVLKGLAPATSGVDSHSPDVKSRLQTGAMYCH